MKQLEERANKQTNDQRRRVGDQTATNSPKDKIAKVEKDGKGVMMEGGGGYVGRG